MSPLPPLKGEADRECYSAQAADGVAFLPNQGVFPLLTQETDGSFRFIGTAFFVAPAGIFLTAAHVVADVPHAHGAPTQPLAAVQFNADGTYLLRSVHVTARSPRADLAIGYLSPLQHRETGEPYPNRVVTLSATEPKPGDPVVTFAYPKTRTLAGPPHRLDFEPTYFAGHVVQHWPAGRDAILLPSACFQTTMVLHGGASGGPVFGPDGGAFGINSTGFGEDELSFVSSVWDAIDLPIPNIRLSPKTPPQTTSLRELITLGIIEVK
jgi:Trypsin-like peptidase domain